MTRTLRIADKLTLPIDFVTMTQAVLAKKGKGKSYTGSVEAEELLELGQQVIVIDPTDAWYGLRSSADGKSAGYPIPVFGGDHGDVPLKADAGTMLAEAVASEHFSAIICTDNFSKGEELRFMAAFLETLYRKNRTAMHLFVDEADIFAPQRTFGVDEARVLGAMDNIVRRGRKKGIGCTLISQRAQVINKNVLSQIDMMVAMGMNHPLDLDGVHDWVKRHDTKGVGQQMIDSLPSLAVGHAWVWNPTLDILKQVAIRRRRTFDSGATPKAGEKAIVAKVLAPVDIQRLGERIAATAEQAKQNDPKTLRAEIVKLKQQLAEAGGSGTLRAEDTIWELEMRVAAIVDVVNDAQRFAASIGEQAAVMSRKLRDTEMTEYEAKVKAKTKRPKGLIVPVEQPLLHTAPTTLGAGLRALTPPDVSKPELRVLSALRWLEAIGISEPNAVTVAFLSKYSGENGAFNRARGHLHTMQMVAYPRSGLITLTDLGRHAVPAPEVPPTTKALHAAVMERLEGPLRRVLQPLLDAHPQFLNADDLSQAAGYSGENGAFNRARGRLRTLGLIEYPSKGTCRAADLMFLEGK